MKEPDGKGVANHSGPESCAGDGNIAGEALTGATRASHRAPKSFLRRADLVLTRGRRHHERRQSQAAYGRRGV